jgi:hypothetical protein
VALLFGSVTFLFYICTVIKKPNIMSYPTQEEIREFIATHGLSDDDLCAKECLDPDDDCSEMGINLGYIWSFGYNCWFDKDKTYTDREEQILDLFKNDGEFKLPKRTVTVTIERHYSKTATIEVEVDDDLVDEDLQEYLTNDEVINDQLENALSEASLQGDDTIYEYSDPTNNDGGHL